MTDENHFNQLTPAEAERLAILSEELGEVQQVIGKILRHGYDSAPPKDPADTNRSALVREAGDVLVALRLMYDSGDISLDDVLARTQEKLVNIRQWLHHQDPSDA